MPVDIAKPRGSASPGTQNVEIRRAGPEDLEAIQSTLSQAFFADRVFEWMLPDASRRLLALPGLFVPIVRAFQVHDDVYLTGDGDGVAVWLPPGADAVPGSEAEAFGETIARIAGPDADRVFEAMALLEENHPHEAHYYLQFLAVAPGAQGRGVGSALLSAMLARCDREQAPAYLEATSELNRDLYERHGFETVGVLTLPNGPSLYPMWRVPA